MGRAIFLVRKINGIFGGIQGDAGQLFGSQYDVGSWQDYLMEAFAGPHDAWDSIMYDAQGNLMQAYESSVLGTAYSGIGILAVSPFVAASVTPLSAIPYGEL